MMVVLRTLALLMAMASLGGCVAPFPPELQAENADRVEEVLADAYEEVGQAYNGEVAVSEMALAGLANLASVEPSLALEQSGDTVTMSLGTESVYRFDKPAGESAHEWAEAVSAALIAVHGRSERLRQIEPRRLYDSYMNGLTSALGGDSQYFPSEEFYAYLYASIDGLVDLTYMPVAEGLRLVSLDRDSHLDAVGLKTNDVITHIDGKATAGRSRFEVYSLLRGPVDTKIVFNVLRDGKALPSTIVVQRWLVEPRNFTFRRTRGVAVYDLPVLNEFAAFALAKSLAVETKRTDARSQLPHGILLDLRGEPPVASNVVRTPSVALGPNRRDWSSLGSYIHAGFMAGPGGSPEAARGLVTAFMSDGVVVLQRGRQSGADTVIEAGGIDPSDQLPLVVVVDSFTIGGAEIAAAALQDSGRALVIGAGTAGSGTIRRNVSLNNLGIVNLPWAFAHAPSGYGIEGRGVTPQICTSLPGGTLQGLLNTLRRGEGLIPDAQLTRVMEPDDTVAIAEQRALCPPAPDSGDLAYELGMALLKEPELYARLINQARRS
ncbi:S41 family peptidase [Pelagibius marinus]|uniref:S41 family peptidase n=1 Tax=Pelagibius marinus TaxID=2762760 RepID=UPI001872A590|nr:S41 family peptidase [Pelagibius marinus]